MKTVAAIGQFLGKYFALFVLGAAVLCFLVPSLITWVLPYVSILLGVVMFGMGLTLKRSDFAEVLKRPKDVILGVCAHYLIMPLIAWLLCLVFRLPGPVAVGVLLVGSCPSGTSSNVMCFLAKGDVALSVSIGAVSTLIAPVMMPLALLVLGGHWVHIEPMPLFISVLEVVVLPVVLGVLVNTFFGAHIEKVTLALPLVSTVAIILIAAGVVAASRDALVKPSTLLVIPVVMLHNLLGYTLGYLFGRVLGMSKAKCKAITFEVGMQNSALASTLALAFFSPIAAVPATVFSVWHNMSGSTLAGFWASKDAVHDAAASEPVESAAA